MSQFGLNYPSNARHELGVYHAFYFLQGCFFGTLGPLLPLYASLSSLSIVYFGPIFSAHGIGALISPIAMNMILHHQLHHRLLLFSILLFAGCCWILPLVVKAGVIGICCVFFLQGFAIGCGNLIINRCGVLIFMNTLVVGETFQKSLIFCFGSGMSLGPLWLLVLQALSSDGSPLHYVSVTYDVLGGLLCGLMLYVSCWTTSPETTRTSPSRGHLPDEAIALLNESTEMMQDPWLIFPWTLPSPLGGGVLLSLKPALIARTKENEGYDQLGSFIVLIVTILTTIYAGMYWGLCGFLYQYLEQFNPGSTLPSGRSFHWLNLVMMSGFWGSFLLSFIIWNKLQACFQKCFALVYQTLGLMICMFFLVRPTEMKASIRMSLLFCYGWCLSTFFVQLIGYLMEQTRFSLTLKRKMPSMLIFGIGCGEIFIPMFIGFFMGDESGASYGSIALLYILFILSTIMFGGLLVFYFSIRRLHNKTEA